MSATLNLIKAYNALYVNEISPANPPPASLPNYRNTMGPIISRWTFPGPPALGPGKIDEVESEASINQFISMPDAGVIENCIGFHWYDLMFNISFNDPRRVNGLALGAQPEKQFPPYHLIFAYLIENTRIIPIFERLIQKFMTSEDFGHASEFTAHWIRNTQSLFYKDMHIPNFRPLISSLLPSFDASRRNAYYRLFGLELSHGNQDNSPVPFVKPSSFNQSFVPLLENLLREIWQGIINHRNTSGANTTDVVALADSARLLKDLLLSRRNASLDLSLYETSSLSKEEFFSVIMLEWFYQVIASNTDLVRELNAEAVMPHERLAILGKLVGITPHSKSRDLFELAPLLAIFLRLMEEGYYDDPANINALFDPSVPNTFAKEISLIITLWQKTTGRNLKQMPNTSYASNGQRMANSAVLVR
ncbi:hypothetical protein J2I47_21145 [Fibrella sp. HMF5335]|uniref:Uncharacterized protein n=1 Tax=Fibrella rubiginis TaxID=2817060 RepID=A0A939GKR0_9BACT|nr:hypothetical protein [Fibrella rubiginis]MBO0939074.1 hypothetical protein [Fibrella rubiginis]